MSDTIKRFLSAAQARSNSSLSELLARHIIPSDQLRQAVRYSLLSGGKRVRPALVYAASEACGEINQNSEYLACAIEAIHCYSLIHDDLPAMDDDDLRRGQATNHKVYGEAMAILAGDLLQSLAFEWLADCPTLTASAFRHASKTLSANAALMVSGQALDIDAANTEQTFQQLDTMHRNKTGALIQASLILGGLACDADQDQLHALGQYGNAIGLAFQVKDDILDVEGDTATLGKQQGADVKHNKPTFVSLLGLNGAKDHAATLREEALSALSGFDKKADTLRQLAEYIIERRH